MLTDCLAHGRRPASPATFKNASGVLTNKAQSLVAASSFHDWIVSDKEADSGEGRQIIHTTPTEYFKSLRLNGNISEIEPLED